MWDVSVEGLEATSLVHGRRVAVPVGERAPMVVTTRTAMVAVQNMPDLASFGLVSFAHGATGNLPPHAWTVGAIDGGGLVLVNATATAGLAYPPNTAWVDHLAFASELTSRNGIAVVRCNDSAVVWSGCRCNAPSELTRAMIHPTGIGARYGAHHLGELLPAVATAPSEAAMQALADAVCRPATASPSSPACNSLVRIDSTGGSGDGDLDDLELDASLPSAVGKLFRVPSLLERGPSALAAGDGAAGLFAGSSISSSPLSCPHQDDVVETSTVEVKVIGGDADDPNPPRSVIQSLVCVPPPNVCDNLLAVNLFDHQRHAVAFMRDVEAKGSLRGGILGDAMGLGKH